MAMENILKKTVTTLQSLNNYVDKKIVSEKAIKEEYENIQDFKQLQEDIDQNIKIIRSINPHNIKEIKDNLFDMHLLVMDYYWHLDQPKMLIEPFIGKYRKLVNMKDTAK